MWLGIGSRLKRGYVLGAGPADSRWLNKIKASYPASKYQGRGGREYSFDDWNEDREKDGILCRNHDDCKWIDERYFSPFSRFFSKKKHDVNCRSCA